MSETPSSVCNDAKSGHQVVSSTGVNKIIIDPAARSRDQGLPCYELDPISDTRWAALVDNHKASSLFHSPAWLRALHAVYGYQPVVVTTCAPDQPLTNGLVFCQIDSWLTGRRLVSLPFSDHCEPIVNDSAELDKILLHAKKSVR